MSRPLPDTTALQYLWNHLPKIIRSLVHTGEPLLMCFTIVILPGLTTLWPRDCYYPISQMAKIKPEGWGIHRGHSQSQWMGQELTHVCLFRILASYHLSTGRPCNNLFTPWKATTVVFGQQSQHRQFIYCSFMLHEFGTLPRNFSKQSWADQSHCEPKCEKNLKKNGHMYMHNWITLLYTWN